MGCQLTRLGWVFANPSCPSVCLAWHPFSVCIGLFILSPGRAQHISCFHRHHDFSSWPSIQFPCGLETHPLLMSSCVPLQNVKALYTVEVLCGPLPLKLLSPFLFLFPQSKEMLNFPIMYFNCISPTACQMVVLEMTFPNDPEKVPFFMKFFSPTWFYI